jgi:citrate lyase beta subunit
MHDAPALMAEFERITRALAEANRAVAEHYPGASATRQPVHTVYGGAHLFSADVAQRFGALALKALDEYAPDPAALALALDLPLALMGRIFPAIVAKLTREPVEDYRIDFEDGFGNRSDAEEDRYSGLAAEQLAAGMASGQLPFCVGVRIKPFTDELAPRSLRTLNVLLSRLLDLSDNRLPPTFLITLPKITSPAQVAALALACDALERAYGLPPGALAIELMIETTQSVFAPDGTVALPRLVAEGGGRVVAAHFGTYDYTAACGITAAEQHMLHPACDFAKHTMQVALAGTSVRLSDGATNIMPIGPHRERSGSRLTSDERRQNLEVVHRAWRLQMAHIRHSLVGGFYQGWDLHPAQLPARYAALYAFFLEGLQAASTRLRNFVDKAAQTTIVGDVFDDAATGQGLLNYFVRAVNCGAISEADASQLSGLTVEELKGRSFAAILEGRRGSRTS